MINLLPEENKKFFRVDYFYRLLGMYLGVLAVLLVILIISAGTLYMVFRLNVRSLDELSSVAKYNTRAEANQIGKDIALTNNIIKALGNSFDAVEVSAIWSDILLNKPVGIKITGLQLEDQAGIWQGELRGLASNRQVLVDFSKVLEKKPGFMSVNLPISNLIRNEQGDFAISFKVKPI